LAAAESTIRDALDADLTSAEVHEELIAPALWLIGELWERGEISVADEHAATEISLRVLALEREAQRVARARGGHRVMLATPPGELHVVALRMVDSLLAAAGYNVDRTPFVGPPRVRGGGGCDVREGSAGIRQTGLGGPRPPSRRPSA
jgi:methanogenic corrinoid protein MtbC1